MRHLVTGDALWCPIASDEMDVDETEDPRDATCPDCLKRAAAFGAAAAVRYAAVEAGATQDPELVRERDDAIHRFNAINDALEGQRAFFCTGCLALFPIKERRLNVNRVSWCKQCAPHGVET